METGVTLFLEEKFQRGLQLLSIAEALCPSRLSVSLWNDLSDPVFDGVGLAGFKSRANAFLLA